MVAVSGVTPMARKYGSIFSLPINFHEPSRGIGCLFLQLTKGGSTTIFQGSSSTPRILPN